MMYCIARTPMFTSHLLHLTRNLLPDEVLTVLLLWGTCTTTVLLRVRQQAIFSRFDVTMHMYE